MTTEIPVNYCLLCGYKFECASTLGDDESERPEPGSLSVCMKCGAVAKFAADLSVVPLTDEEAAAITADFKTMEYLNRIVSGVRIVRELHIRRN